MYTSYISKVTVSESGLHQQVRACNIANCLADCLIDLPVSRAVGAVDKSMGQSELYITQRHFMSVKISSLD